MNRMEKYLISCDWLQCYCLATKQLSFNCYYYSGEIGPHGYNSAYLLKESTDYNPSYKVSYDVYQNKLKIASIFVMPRGLNRKNNAASIKLANRLLYCSDFIFYLYDVCKAIGFEIVGITRLDLCYDCNYFANHLHPLGFINKYAITSRKKKFSPITRDHSNKFTLIGTKKKDVTSFDYLRFGSHKSACSAYIYNKSKELNDVKEKSYIRAAWKEIGLDDKNVWRSEISISCKGLDVMNLATREIFRLSPAAIESQQKIEDLWYVYAKQYLSFRKVDGTKNKRYYEHLPIFEQSGSPAIKPRFVNRTMDSGRREQMAYNVLKDIKEHVDGYSPDEYIALTKSMKLMGRIMTMKDKISKVARNANIMSRWHSLTTLEKDYLDIALQNPINYLKVDKYDRLPQRTLTSSALKMANAMRYNMHSFADELEIGFIPIMR